MESRCSRAGCVSTRPVAGYDPAAVLQLSRHGRAWHYFHRGNGFGRADVVEWEIIRLGSDALVGDDLLSAAVHRQYRGMDDRRAGASALAHLRADAHGSRSLAAGWRGQCMVYAYRLHGPVYRAGHSVSVSCLSIFPGPSEPRLFFALF